MIGVGLDLTTCEDRRVLMSINRALMGERLDRTQRSLVYSRSSEEQLGEWSSCNSPENGDLGARCRGCVVVAEQVTRMILRAHKKVQDTPSGPHTPWSTLRIGIGIG